MWMTKHERLQQSLENAREKAYRIENSQTTDVIIDLIEAIDLLSDMVYDLQKDDSGHS